LLRKAAQLQPDNRFVYLDMSSILVDQKRYPEALDALRHAVKLNPLESDAHFRMGHVYQLMGNKAAAEKEFAKVRALKKKEDEDLAAKVKKLPPTARP
jgi:tetratricopeptide (TPR) repeat protein